MFSDGEQPPVIRVQKDHCKWPNVEECLPAGHLPEIGRPYWVKCKHFRCMAVVDKEGKWKAFYGGEELPEVLNVFVTQ